MKPRSSHDETDGLRYFARMLDKIRLHAEGKLEPDYHSNLGRGMDQRMVKFLRVEYSDLKTRVLEGGSDSEILEWCFTHGRNLDQNDIVIWNSFSSKLGWNDFASDYLAELKMKNGLADRDDIQTMGQLFDVEEGRKS